MTRRQWLFLGIAALVGYSTVALFFMRYEPASRWSFAIDRKAIESQVKTYALQHGIDATNWTVAIQVDRNQQIEKYLASLPQQKLNAFEKNLLPLLLTRAKLIPPNREGRVLFMLGPNGQILDYTRDNIKSQENTTANNDPRATATAALQQALGEQAQNFALSSESQPENNSKKYVWTYNSPNDSQLRFTAEVLVSGDLVTGLKLRETLPNEFQDKLKGRGINSFAFFGIARVILNVLLVLVALVLVFLTIARKEVQALSTLKFATAMAMLSILDFYLAGQYEDFFASLTVTGVKNATLLRLFAIILFWAISIGYALITTSFWVVGETTSAKYRTGREAVFSAFVSGKIFTRAVAQNVLAGFLCGGLLAAIPILFAIFFQLPSVPNHVFSAHEFFVARMPALMAIAASLISSFSCYILILFGFLTPFLGANVRANWLRQIILLCVGLIFFVVSEPNQSNSLGLKLSYALLLYGLFYWLFREFDLLAVLSTSFFASLLINGFSYLLQPSATLHQAGIITLAALGIFGALAFALTFIGSDEKIEQRVIQHSVEDQAERDRLKASFEVARKAQDKMLPDAAPEIPGLSIAALCRPARECGGDLYDFITMPDGKLGVVVADVSGKGVPAALYMTLTKGLFASVTEELDDPGAILCEVNRHLYEVCKRKMFVTLFFGIIDPITKTMKYARAGHNPPVLRSMTNQASQLLQPAGIGLGLNSGKTFNRILKVEEIQLQPNDVLVMYSDGITEAMNEWQEEYGEERLMKATQITDGMLAEETLSALIADVSFFLGKTAPQDDQTLVVIRVK